MEESDTKESGVEQKDEKRQKIWRDRRRQREVETVSKRPRETCDRSPSLTFSH